jgi:phage protein U
MKNYNIEKWHRRHNQRSLRKGEGLTVLSGAVFPEEGTFELTLNNKISIL